MELLDRLKETRNQRDEVTVMLIKARWHHWGAATDADDKMLEEIDEVIRRTRHAVV